MENKKRLIDASSMDALEDLDYEYAPERDGCAWYRAADVWACIERAPTVDAVEVAHGCWIEDYQPLAYGFNKIQHKCSVCGGIHRQKSNYCPDCGAKMDGKENEHG